MGEEETGRVWDREVQAFIKGCRQSALTDIKLTDEGPGDGSCMRVDATYQTKRGRLLPVSFYWEYAAGQRTAMVRLGKATAPFERYADTLLRLAVRAGLWRERRRAAAAVLSASTIYYRAHAARGRLQEVQMRALRLEEQFARLGSRGVEALGTVAPVRVKQVEGGRRRALATLNDLAHLYGRHAKTAP